MKQLILATVLSLFTLNASADMTGIPKNIYSGSTIYAFSIETTDPSLHQLGIYELWYCLTMDDTALGKLRIQMIETVTAAMASNSSITVAGDQSSFASCNIPGNIRTNR